MLVIVRGHEVLVRVRGQWGTGQSPKTGGTGQSQRT